MYDYDSEAGLLYHDLLSQLQPTLYKNKCQMNAFINALKKTIDIFTDA